MYSAVSYSAPGVVTDFAVPFPYLDVAHLEVTVNAVAAAFTMPNSATVRLTVAPAAGATVMIRRNTNRTGRLVDFSDGANLTEDALDRNSNQLFFVAQEALDQATTQSYFTSDASGARVTNVADPVLDTDAATKHWVTNYVTSVAGGGSNLLPLNNEWTGTNRFDTTVNFGNAQWNLTDVATKQLLQLQNSGMKVVNDTATTTSSFGLWSLVKRNSGVAGVSDGMTGVNGTALQFATGSPWVGFNYGGAFTAWKGPGVTGITVGALSNVTILNPDDRGRKIGVQIEFFNHEYGYTQGGQSPTWGVLPQGTGTNYYNSNSDAIWVSATGRTEANATYVGWNRGIRFTQYGLDIAKVNAYDATVTYVAGDYVTSGGNVWMCQNPTMGVAPVQGPLWTFLKAGSEIGPVGIDFASIDSSTMGNMIAAIRLKGQMPIAWNSEGGITTSYDPITGLFSWRNKGGTITDIDMGTTVQATGDILVKGERRILGTRSSVSVHRNGGAFVLPGNAWTPIAFPFKERDDRGEFNTATNEFQPTSPGDYQVILQIQTEGYAPSNIPLRCSILKNGVFYKATAIVTGSAAAGQSCTATCTSLVRMNGTTDKLTFQALWSDSSNAPITGEPAATYLQISKVF
jgi:hypothetical protein